jgi:hypothetical protein
MPEILNKRACWIHNMLYYITRSDDSPYNKTAITCSSEKNVIHYKQLSKTDLTSIRRLLDLRLFAA